MNLVEYGFDGYTDHSDEQFQRIEKSSLGKSNVKLSKMLKSLLIYYSKKYRLVIILICLYLVVRIRSKWTGMIEASKK